MTAASSCRSIATRIFRRSLAYTQAEWQTQRFGGLGAEMLRGWMAGWQVFMNMFILGWVGIAMGKIGELAFDWPLWAQIIVALFVLDFIQWCVHNLLHRVPLFWEFHKAHHSVKDGEMDWIVAFRFSWLEVIVYKSVLYLPMVFLGFRWEALMFHAIFGTLIGHLNHANLNLGHGWWRYVLNSPRMHIWHHDYDGNARTTVNFGIIFSCWDWIFGTARMPDDPPPHIGFAGVETFPDNFFSQEIWPLQKLAPGVKNVGIWTLVGALVMAALWVLSRRG